jgi:hypothetical protein
MRGVHLEELHVTGANGDGLGALFLHWRTLQPFLNGRQERASRG